ncbi:MAG: hypothetical protein FP818_12240 [Rhodocyclaceae bacterium]|nr:hypothetical protein [Rhodocyclaceae bacterium]
MLWHIDAGIELFDRRIFDAQFELTAITVLVAEAAVGAGIQGLSRNWREFAFGQVGEGLFFQSGCL